MEGSAQSSHIRGDPVSVPDFSSEWAQRRNNSGGRALSFIHSFDKLFFSIRHTGDPKEKSTQPGLPGKASWRGWFVCRLSLEGQIKAFQGDKKKECFRRHGLQ